MWDDLYNAAEDRATKELVMQRFFESIRDGEASAVKVYRLQNDITRFLGLTSVHPEDAGLLMEVGGGAPLTHVWRAIPVMVAREYEAMGDDLVLGDLASTFVSCPILSQRAVDGLKSMLERHGELLPLASSLGTFFVFNPLAVRDAIDFGRSEINYLPNGAIRDRRNRYSFLPEVIGDAAVFMVPQLRATIFVTDRFVRDVVFLGLQGFQFSLIWDGDET